MCRISEHIIYGEYNYYLVIGVSLNFRWDSARTNGAKPSLFLIVDPRNVIYSILKFTRQPGGQSDIVWCYSGLQI